ncbi:MAG: DUF4349 domain-containing protein, partial [Methylophilaceae bacterium]
MKKLGLVILIFCALVACGKQESASITPATASYEIADAVQSKRGVKVEGGAEQSLTQMSEPSDNNTELKKYIALRHHLSIETPAENMQASFDAAVNHCSVLNCQLLSANYNRETPYSPPSASLSVRVPPRNVTIFLSGLAKHGEVLSHRRDSEDKTNQVVDTDARIKNLTELRDRLRSMLADKTAKFKDIIDVQREL